MSRVLVRSFPLFFSFFFASLASLMLGARCTRVFGTRLITEPGHRAKRFCGARHSSARSAVRKPQEARTTKISPASDATESPRVLSPRNFPLSDRILITRRSATGYESLRKMSRAANHRDYVQFSLEIYTTKHGDCANWPSPAV